MKHDWIKGKQDDPYQRPRIDWWATWRQFIPFWGCVGLIAAVAAIGYVFHG